MLGLSDFGLAFLPSSIVSGLGKHVHIVRAVGERLIQCKGEAADGHIGGGGGRWSRRGLHLVVPTRVLGKVRVAHTNVARHDVG